MAGHSKWANIKHRKARQDASRGKIFTKYIREIVSAAKQGDPDPAKNPRLRAVVEKALSVNMTRDTINRAIDGALAEAERLGIGGKALTPFLLDRIQKLTGGDSLDSNIQLVLNNAALAARIAAALKG